MPKLFWYEVAQPENELSHDNNCCVEMEIVLCHEYIATRTLHEKCPNTELFLVRFFLCSDEIRRFTE